MYCAWAPALQSPKRRGDLSKRHGGQCYMHHLDTTTGLVPGLVTSLG
jgi:hypothetical protein